MVPIMFKFIAFFVFIMMSFYAMLNVFIVGMGIPSSTNALLFTLQSGYLIFCFSSASFYSFKASIWGFIAFNDFNFTSFKFKNAIQVFLHLDMMDFNEKYYYKDLDQDEIKRLQETELLCEETDILLNHIKRNRNNERDSTLPKIFTC